MIGEPIPTLIVAGGGTRYRTWLQIKADVSGCNIRTFAEPEAILLGAALVAGIGCGVYRDVTDAMSRLAQCATEVYVPDPERKVYVHLHQELFRAPFRG
jgi:xylulokinase